MDVKKHEKVVGTGTSFNGFDVDFMAMRYNADGSLDTSYGVSGKVVINFSTESRDRIKNIALDSSGRAIAVGYATDGAAAIAGNLGGGF